MQKTVVHCRLLGAVPVVASPLGGLNACTRIGSQQPWEQSHGPSVAQNTGDVASSKCINMEALNKYLFY
jgi:hypothetical protein